MPTFAALSTAIFRVLTHESGNEITSGCTMDRDIFPLYQDAASEVGKPGYPGGLITRRAVSTFAKLQVAVSSNQPLATLFTNLKKAWYIFIATRVKNRIC